MAPAAGFLHTRSNILVVALLHRTSASLTRPLACIPLPWLADVLRCFVCIRSFTASHFGTLPNARRLLPRLEFHQQPSPPATLSAFANLRSHLKPTNTPRYGYDPCDSGNPRGETRRNHDECHEHPQWRPVATLHRQPRVVAHQRLPEHWRRQSILADHPSQHIRAQQPRWRHAQWYAPWHRQWQPLAAQLSRPIQRRYWPVRLQHQ